MPERGYAVANFNGLLYFRGADNYLCLWEGEPLWFELCVGKWAIGTDVRGSTGFFPPSYWAPGAPSIRGANPLAGKAGIQETTATSLESFVALRTAAWLVGAPSAGWAGGHTPIKDFASASVGPSAVDQTVECAVMALPLQPATSQKGGRQSCIEGDKNPAIVVRECLDAIQMQNPDAELDRFRYELATRVNKMISQGMIFFHRDISIKEARNLLWSSSELSEQVKILHRQARAAEQEADSGPLAGNPGVSHASVNDSVEQTKETNPWKFPNEL